MYGTPSAWRVPGYTEIRELGTGAAGRVVMARHDADGVLVAIKYLSDELRGDVGFVARFRHEARVLNTLNSPHSVRLYDYVETGDGAAIVMELINGVALRALLRSEGPTGPEAALLVLKGSLMGLAAAHSAGVVHRDFKPENVMVEADGKSKLVDFGIALRSGDGDAPAGTPPYMAPEQWVGGPAGPSTDVYAATVVFFECLTGARPFRATNIAALARQHQVMPPPVEEVPPALQGLVERGLAKHATDRPPTASAFLTELEAVAADAYGPDWQERGRRRLAGIVGLLAELFPLDAPAPAADTSLATTDLGGEGGVTSSLGKLSVKILIGVGCIAVIGGLIAVLVGSNSSTTIQPQSSTVTKDPTPSDPLETVIPGDDGDELDDPDEPAEASPTAGAPSATPTPSNTASGLPPAPTATTPSKTPKASATPTRKPTARPTRKPTGEASEPPSPEESSTLSDPGKPNTPTTRPPSPTATATSTQPSASPTQTQPTTSSPTGTEPGETSTPEGTPRLTSSPLPPVGTAPSAFLALGLVTSGAVPFTLAVKRGMVGRHRKRR
ncbi:serine/threonine-protein kinase [Streptosporangium amethystogenes]|uniref:serine/threonine-protein kinase n=1 Tax=Streptosporangium amethystogenes TaxID=2002 RepID=UPI0004CB9504|nr:serine/threonine-protein kinase [Streptosporangium amethystogenes]